MKQSVSHKDCHQKINRDREWLLGEILCNLYLGLGRYQRGEKLAAYDLIQNRAVKLWTELISLETTSKSNFIDIFNTNRRFEEGYPKEAKQLPHFLARLRTLFLSLLKHS